MRTSKGFGLLELMVVLVIAGLLASLAIPAYSQFVDRARTAKAIGDIASIGLEIEKFCLVNDSPPLNAKASRDDVVRANNGAYIGRAKDY